MSERSLTPGLETEAEAEHKRSIDQYTLQMRTKLEKRVESTSLRKRFISRLEALNRSIWYRIFKMWAHNPPLEQRIPISQISSIFIIPFGDAIGDMVVATSVFRVIKSRNPSCRTGTLVSARNRSIIRCDTDIDDQYFFQDRRDFFHYSEIFRARQKGYDVVVNLNLNHMTEWGIIANIISPQGIKLSCSHDRKHKYQILFNHLAPFKRNSMHISQLQLSIMEEAIDFGEPIKLFEARPSLHICDDTQKATRARIERQLSEVHAAWFICFNTQARSSSREWGMDNSVAFAKRCEEQYPDAAIFFTSSPVRRSEIESLIKHSGLKRSRVFATSYDLLEIAELAKNARLIVTPDTSITHFASAAQTPTLVLWSDNRRLGCEWLPLLTHSRIIIPREVDAAVSTIPVDEVWNTAVDLLEGNWQSTQTSFEVSETQDILFQDQCSNKTLKEVIALSKLPQTY